MNFRVLKILMNAHDAIIDAMQTLRANDEEFAADELCDGKVALYQAIKRIIQTETIK